MSPVHVTTVFECDGCGKSQLLYPDGVNVDPPGWHTGWHTYEYESEEELETYCASCWSDEMGRPYSPQMLSLMQKYRADSVATLVAAIRDEYNAECVDLNAGEEPFTLKESEIILDRMLDAEYHRLESTHEA